MKNLIIACLTIFIGTVSFSQNANWRLFPSGDSTNAVKDTGNQYVAMKFDTIKEVKVSDKPGKTNINKDARLDKVSKELGTPNDGVSVKIHGFRLQLVASSKKDAIDGERAKFVAIHNDVPTYMDYRQPNFRLRVGDFRTKLEAQKLQHELKDVFPSAIVVNDMIELPKINSSEK